MHDETLLKALQCEIFPRCSAIIGMRDGPFVIMIKILSRNEHDQNGRVFRPCLVRVDEQIEERLSMFRAPARIKRPPLLRIE